MKIRIENLGKIKQAEFDLNKLNVIVGKNNSGKTYLSYSIYNTINRIISNKNTFNLIEQFFNSYLSEKDNTYLFHVNDLKNFIIKNFIPNIIDQINKNITKDMKSDNFTNTKIDINDDFDIDDSIIKSFDIKEFGFTFDDNFKDTFSYFFLKEKNDDIFYFKVFQSDKMDPILFDEKDRALNGKKLMEINNLYKPTLLRKDLILENLSNLVVTSFTKLFYNPIYSYFFNNKYPPNIMYLPSSREGLIISLNEIISGRNKQLSNYREKIFDFKNNSFLKTLRKEESYYPKPVDDYINFLIESKISENKTNKQNLITEEFNKMIEGKYEIEDNKIFFIPNSYKKRLEMYLSSSIIKSLFGLNQILQNSDKNSILIIDEPEANLHPDNQRKIARIFAMMINYGYKIIITTHSDVIIRELSNLIALNRLKDEHKKELITKYDINENSVLNKEDVNFYKLDNSVLEKVEYDEDHIFIDSFDEVINNQNNLFFDIDEIDEQ